MLGCCVDFALWKGPHWENISGSALSRCEQTCGQRLGALEEGWLTMTYLPLSCYEEPVLKRFLGTFTVQGEKAAKGAGGTQVLNLIEFCYRFLHF